MIYFSFQPVLHDLSFSVSEQRVEMRHFLVFILFFQYQNQRLNKYTVWLVYFCQCRNQRLKSYTIWLFVFLSMPELTVNNTQFGFLYCFHCRNQRLKIHNFGLLFLSSLNVKSSVKKTKTMHNLTLCVYLFLTPNSRSVFRAGVSLNIHSFILIPSLYFFQCRNQWLNNTQFRSFISFLFLFLSSLNVKSSREGSGREGSGRERSIESSVKKYIV